MDKLKVDLPSLTCASCVSQIEHILRQQEGVIWAIVNFAAREATIIVDPKCFHALQVEQSLAPLGIKLVWQDETVNPGAPGKTFLQRLERVQHLARVLHLLVLG